MGRKGNPIAVRLDVNRKSDSSWFSDYYYGKLVYQDVNLRSYLGSIRPPTKKTFGFRLGKCVIQHFPKVTVVHNFLPHRPKTLDRKSTSKGQWWAFGKVKSIEHSDTEENEVRDAGKRVKSVAATNQKKKLANGYHDQSNPLRELRISGALGPKAGNDIAFLRDDSFKKTECFKFFFPDKSSSCGNLLQRVPAVRPSLSYLVMHDLLNAKKRMHFDPVIALNHFVTRGAAEPSTIEGSEGGRLDQRIRSRIAFLVENSSSKSLSEGKLTHFIRQANDLRYVGTRKNSISLFPFFGATFFFLRDGVYKKHLIEDSREQFLGQLRTKCWNLLGKEVKLIDKVVEQGEVGELLKGVEMMTEIILRNRRIPYGYNSYLNELEKMRSFVSDRTGAHTLIESVKIKSVYQSASLIAQDIAFQMMNRKRTFRSIFGQIVKEIPLVMPKGVDGIRVCVSGRLRGAEIARSECGKYGKTSCNVFNQKIDYALSEVSTRYGILGVKVWISYSQRK
ncbi:uncharacterized protein LOC113288661 [Papaver somniferum]|nr:uncharacterized protein LOC113288661 [Papaver somniferum]XP_026393554.1 uncharacterized protein LOC113288661 [Papaver somniferum]XP_026393555.1 uncharacterized protein LOC113288661 [Papaver somniferum]XP_026393556.1 uncharacterized protein LOC113288661 [Papaver somniferum]XP_026393557.1 uncharacterized protein LOC113288661 [Papaver somniferum]XP_026393558.1 uncharacterized protein LOC113288661 [Papaver somniferum]XP_026393559.1 uncharacterized protein LOC113288661 [Papaver somniferum]XP_0